MSQTKEQAAAWHQANKERRAARAKAHYLENRESILTAQRERRGTEEYKQAHSEYNKAYYQNNKDKILAQKKVYNNTPERKLALAEWNRQWRANNQELKNVHYNRYRARKLNQAIPFTKDQLQARFEYWGNKCWMCGTEDNLTMDHVKPLSKGGLDTPSNLRPACKSCNSSKNNKWPYPLKT